MDKILNRLNNLRTAELARQKELKGLLAKSDVALAKIDEEIRDHLDLVVRQDQTKSKHDPKPPKTKKTPKQIRDENGHEKP